jgi:hypothetical protein
MIQPGLTFDNESHKYHWNGLRKPSVTGIIGSVGTKRVVDGREMWVSLAPMFGDTEDRTAADFGTAFHKIAAIFLKGGNPSYPAEMEPWVAQFQRFLLDNYGELERSKKLIVVDWKTSTVFQKHWRQQLFAYVSLAKYVIRKYKVNNEVWPLIEEPMFHEIMDYCGTPDLVIGNFENTMSHADAEYWTVRFDGTERPASIDKRSTLKNPEDGILWNSILNIYKDRKAA